MPLHFCITVMNKDFSNNPFAKLQNKVQVKAKGKASKAINKPISKPNSKPSSMPENSGDADDSMLFLNAMQNTKLSQKNTSKHPPLAEHEDFTKLKKNQQKNTIPSNNQDNITHIEPNTLVESNDDEQAFFKAMQEVAPLGGKGRDVVPEVQLTQPNVAEQSYTSLIESRVEFAMALKGEYLEAHVVGLDENIMNGLRSGRYSPEASIDLHGLNALQAYNNLVSFFRGAWYKGMRTVLIVPGRGKNSLNGFGVLRDKLQTWLTQDPFKRVVLAFCTARPVDGGPGSVYVLLRKYKKKGKIHWERLPSDPDLF